MADHRTRGTWRDPATGRVALACYAAGWLDSRADLATRTRAGYTSTLAHYVTPDLGEGVELGPVELGPVELGRPHGRSRSRVASPTSPRGREPTGPSRRQPRRRGLIVGSHPV